MPRKRLLVKRNAVIQPLDKSTRLIPLTQNQVTVVDADDYERLPQFNWFAAWNPHTQSFYAARTVTINGKRLTIRMGNAVLGERCGNIVDHIDHNTLNNRRRNLRKATVEQNGRNKRKNRNNKSGYKGVHKSRWHWRAEIWHGKKLIHIGCFDIAEEAAVAYNWWAKKLYGEFAALNNVTRSQR